jgi:hypothetical protein
MRFNSSGGEQMNILTRLILIGLAASSFLVYAQIVGPQFTISPRLGLDLKDDGSAAVQIAGMGSGTSSFNGNSLTDANG